MLVSFVYMYTCVLITNKCITLFIVYFHNAQTILCEGCLCYILFLFLFLFFVFTFLLYSTHYLNEQGNQGVFSCCNILYGFIDRIFQSLFFIWFLMIFALIFLLYLLCLHCVYCSIPDDCVVKVRVSNDCFQGHWSWLGVRGQLSRWRSKSVWCN